MTVANVDFPFSTARPLRIGSRGSTLALVQARMVARVLAERFAVPDGAFDIRVFKTEGDRVQNRALAEIGGKSLWTRELDRALLDDEIDIAVHSMKDVETLLAPGIAIGAVLPRADPRDRLIGAPSIAALPAGALVGTSSPRRVAQLRYRRPDVTVGLLRGNVETRLRKVAEGAVAATFLAAAGLDRLGIAAGTLLEISDWLPAAAQAVVGMTCRADDSGLLSLLSAVDHQPTSLCLNSERAFLAKLGGSCRTAVAAHAQLIAGGHVQLDAELFTPDGKERVVATGSGADGEQVGDAVAATLLATASAHLLETLAT